MRRAAAPEWSIRPLVSGVLVAVFIAAIISAMSWPAQSLIFPLIIAVPGVALGIIQIALDLSRQRSPVEDEDRTGMMDLGAERGVPTGVVVRRASIMLAWILGFFLSVILIGLVITPTLFIVLYLLVHAKSWRAPLLAVVFGAAQLALFHFVLHTRWSEPVFTWPQDAFLRLIGG